MLFFPIFCVWYMLFFPIFCVWYMLFFPIFCVWYMLFFPIFCVWYMLFFPIFQAGMYYIILMDISSTKLYFLTVAFYSLTLIIIFCKYQHFFPSTGMGKPLYWYGKTPLLVWENANSFQYCTRVYKFWITQIKNNGNLN